MNAPRCDGDILPALCNLLLGHGDWPAPRADTAALMEPILAREIRAVVARALQSQFSSRFNKLRPEAIVFALRRDEIMTSRLYQYCSMDIPNIGGTVQGSSKACYRKERLRCNRLAEELGVCTGPPAGGDPELDLRLRRLDRITRGISVAEYKAFYGVRCSQEGVWRDWLRRRCRPTGAPPFSSAAEHVLVFVVRQVAALLLDACLKVRSDRNGWSEDECGVEVDVPTKSVSEQDLREALRRLWVKRPPKADTLLIR